MRRNNNSRRRPPDSASRRIVTPKPRPESGRVGPKSHHWRLNLSSLLWARGLLGFFQFILSRQYIERIKNKRRYLYLPLGERRDFAEAYFHSGLIQFDNAASSHVHSEEVNIHEAIGQSSGALIIYGEPGVGKSSLLHYLIYHALFPNDRRLDPSARLIGGQKPSSWFPLVIDLRDDGVCREIGRIFKSESVDPSVNADNFCTWLLTVTLLWSYNIFVEQADNPNDRIAALNKQKGSLKYIYLLYSLLKHRILQSALITLDGLEQITEIEEETKVRFLNAMNDFAEQYCFAGKKRSCLLVVASRYNRESQLSLHSSWMYWELPPPLQDKKRKMDYLKRVMPVDANIAEIADTLSRNPRIASFTSNPLALSIVAYLNYRNRNNEHCFIDALYHGDFYDAFIEEMWKRGRGGNAVPVCVDAAKCMLGRLALKMLKQQRFSFSQLELEGYIRKTLKKEGLGTTTDTVNWIRRHIVDENCASLLSQSPPRTLSRMEKWIGILLGLSYNERSKQKSSSDRFTFRHFTIQEYFAYHYVSESEGLVSPRVLYNWFKDPWWHGVLIQYLSQDRRALEIIEGDWSGFQEDKTAQKAKRVLEKLEEQAAGYTSLTIPLSLSIELEDKRNEVASYEASLQSRIQNLCSTDQMRLLFVLLQILHAHHKNYGDEIEIDTKVSMRFRKVRSDVIGKILDLSEHETDCYSQPMPNIAGIGLWETLYPEDWKRVTDLLAAEKPVFARTNAIHFCRRIGGERAIDILMECLDDGDFCVQETTINALATLIDQAQTRVYALVCSRSISTCKRRNAIRVMRASTDAKYLEKLIDFGIADNELRQDLKRTVIGIAHDRYHDHLNGVLLGHLGRNPDDRRYKFVYETLIETQASIVTALFCRLIEPEINCFRLQGSIVEVLSTKGARFEVLNQVDQSFRSMIAGLLLPEKNLEHVRFALRILQGTGRTWAVELIEEIYCQGLPVERRRLRAHLRRLRKHDQGREYLPLIDDILIALRSYRFLSLKKTHDRKVM